MNPVVSISLGNDAGALEVPVEVVHAIQSHAEHSVQLAIAVINELGIPRDKSKTLPMPVMLELAALAHLRLWESCQFHRCLDSRLPKCKDAERDFIRRVNADPSQFNSIEAATLSQQVLKIWMTQFAWENSFSTDEPITIAQFDEEAFLDALVEIVWKHRNDLFTSNDEDHDG